MSDQNVSVPTDIAEYREFVAKGGLNASAKNNEPSAAGASQAETESASETEGTQNKEPHQKKSGFQRRVDKLNQKLGAKDAEIAELRRQIEARQGGATKQAGDEKQDPKPEGEKQQAPAAKPKPQQKDFESYDDFVEALTDWKTADALRQREEEKQREAQQQSANDATQAILKAHAERVDEAKTHYDDWNDAFKGLTDQSFTEPMMVAIFESEIGPDVSYFLATHRDELERISKLPQTRQVAEIGRIEARLAKDDAGDGDEAKPAAKPKSEAKAKPSVSQAPAPVKPLKGKSSGDDPMPDLSDFAAYEAWSKRQAAAGRKR